MGENFNAFNEMEKAQEIVNSQQRQGGEAGIVRKVATTVMKELGINSKIDDVRLDNHTWQVNCDKMSGEERQVVKELVAEQLKAINIKPSAIKMVGLYPSK